MHVQVKLCIFRIRWQRVKHTSHNFFVFENIGDIVNLWGNISPFLLFWILFTRFPFEMVSFAVGRVDDCWLFCGDSLISVVLTRREADGARAADATLRRHPWTRHNTRGSSKETAADRIEEDGLF